jgi:hypothetical protein
MEFGCLRSAGRRIAGRRCIRGGAPAAGSMVLAATLGFPLGLTAARLRPGGAAIGL